MDESGRPETGRSGSTRQRRPSRMLADKADGVGGRIVDDRPSEQRAGMRLGPGRRDIRRLGERQAAMDTKLAMGVGIMVAGGNVRRNCGGLAGKTERKQRSPVGTAHLHW